MNCQPQTTKESPGEDTDSHMQMHQMHMAQLADDERVSLHMSPEQAQHQLMNMRSHLQAVQTIVDYLGKDEYDSAAAVASAKLGMSEEMRMMCSAFDNAEFEQLGLAFHQSADKMSEVFKTRNKDKSLAALSQTLNYCVTCHARFKQ